MFERILVVCIGNICRSPTGEALLKQLLPHKAIASAGIHAMVDWPADEQAQKEAAKHGVDLSAHIARQLTPELCHDFDLILVMESPHKDMVARIAPEARGKTMLMGHWLSQKEISDPYRKSDETFALIYRQINEAAHAWAAKLNAS